MISLALNTGLIGSGKTTPLRDLAIAIEGGVRGGLTGPVARL
jgi:hypothetical protein